MSCVSDNFHSFPVKRLRHSAEKYIYFLAESDITNVGMVTMGVGLSIHYGHAQ